MEVIPTYAVVPFRGHIEMTLALCRRLLTDQSLQRIFLCNNDPQYQAEFMTVSLKTRARAQVLRCPDWSLTRMWNAGWRAAVAAAEGKPANLAILNNDILPEADMLSVMAQALRRPEDNWWAVSPDPAADPSRTFVGMVRPTVGTGRPMPLLPDGGMCGWAFMVRTETPAPMPIDEQFRWWCGDDEAVASIRAAGGDAGILRGLHCSHMPSTTYRERRAALQPVILEDIQRFAAKRGFSVEDPRWQTWLRNGVTPV